jgi:hypothetical protein
MAAGSDSYMGLAVPLYGDSIVKQRTAATDILTVEGADGQAGDFLVLRDSTATERFTVEDGGNAVMTQKAAGDIGLKILRASTPTTHAIKVADNGDGTTKQWAITKNYNPLLRIFTTKPTTGLTKGEMMLLLHGSRPCLGVCYSTAVNGIRLIRLRTKTLGRLTA